MTKAIVLALLVAACGGQPAPSIPWNAGLPEGGVVIYHVDHGFGFCTDSGLPNGCPTRIVRVAGLCITEVFYSGNGGWQLRESKSCPG